MGKIKSGEAQENKSSSISIEERLVALARLQDIDSQIDRIRIVRGELPLEVQDLEDEVQGLQTRIDKLNSEIDEIEKNIAEKKAVLVDGDSLIKKYEEQRMNVRNNREYDSLTKEIEYQGLEIQIAEKRIKEYTYAIEMKKEVIGQAEEKLKDRVADLEDKQNKLAEIVSETERDEQELNKRSKDNEKFIEPRLLTAYKRIRENALNGLAVVPIERDACGGCFNQIPPQRQLDIRMHKKIIVCEYCGRILIDKDIVEIIEGE